MKKQILREGQIVQLDPVGTKNPFFAGCIMTITEPKTWGAQGFVQVPGRSQDVVTWQGRAYYRATWDEMSEPIGHAIWMPGDDAPTESAGGS